MECSVTWPKTINNVLALFHGLHCLSIFVFIKVAFSFVMWFRLSYLLPGARSRVSVSHTKLCNKQYRVDTWRVGLSLYINSAFRQSCRPV